MDDFIDISSAQHRIREPDDPKGLEDEDDEEDEEEWDDDELPVGAPREPLFLHLPRYMQVWSYRATQQRLLFRTRWRERGSTITEAEFAGVLGMKTRSHYHGLTIQEVEADPEIDQLLGSTGKLHPAYRRLHLLSNGEPAGFVVCRNVLVRELQTGN
ncbi:hypothetical protein ACF9IK_31380 [Kitasatospora hibisci]|uniref:hypothetical protein n=1 Tax=Kitasatospora hibisci TaxID=3369522 RepID=UPI0037543B56